MAKKKNKQVAPSLSPERFLKERARSLEIGSCYATPNIEECGLGNIIVTRVHKGGKYTIGVFQVDTYCLGVKNATWRVRMDELDYESIIEQLRESVNVEMVSYEEAHNRIYGAIAFAEDAGIEPCQRFDIAQYVLEEDTDDVPLIEYEYGKNGKHFLVAHDQKELDHYLPILLANLGEGNFDFIIDDEDDEDDEEDKDEEIPQYTYRPTRNFPEELKLETPRVLDIIRQEHYLTDDEVDELLALPHDSLCRDLESTILYALGLWWREPDSDKFEFFDAIFHAVMILGTVGDESSLDPVLETLRMDSDFYDKVFGDIGQGAFVPALLCAGRNQFDVLMSFMKEVGIYALNKYYVASAVRHLALEFGLRDEAVEWFRELLHDIIADFPSAEYTDATLNGFIISEVLFLGDRGFLPQIKKLYDLGFVDSFVVGKYPKLEKTFGQDVNVPVDIDLKHRYQSFRDTFGG
ncbi:MAG: hypothetical protein ACI35Q_01590 [Marinilabiliaceae bacterium]